MSKHQLPEDWEACIAFHGHLCPGLALGYRMIREAMARLAANRSEDEEVIAIVENDSCAVDAVQYLSGCTFGKGNFYFRDYGKNVITLALRPSGRAVRVGLKPRGKRLPEPEDRDARTRFMLETPLEELLTVRETTIALPDKAHGSQSVACNRCGEEAMASRTVKRGARILCIPCAREESPKTETSVEEKQG